jgi:hypothetical protein
MTTGLKNITNTTGNTSTLLNQNIPHMMPSLSDVLVIQCVRKVTLHLGYGTQIWLSVSTLPLKCAVVSLYSVVKQRLKCNTGKKRVTV